MTTVITVGTCDSCKMVTKIREVEGYTGRYCESCISPLRNKPPTLGCFLFGIFAVVAVLAAIPWLFLAIGKYLDFVMSYYRR